MFKLHSLRFSCRVALLACLVGSPTFADVKPHALFSDGVVLQRGRKVAIWGSAADGEKVSVDFQGKKAAATTKGGKWKVVLDDLTVGGPYEMTIAGKNEIKLKEVYVGEVWVCSGQSNMTLALTSCGAEAQKTIAASENKLLRLYTVPMTAAETPQENIGTLPGTAILPVWMGCSPMSVTYFSATAYFFGCALQKALGVPVGLIHASVGGTQAETWMRRDVLDGIPEIKPTLGRYAIGYPSSFYNGMIAPLLPFAMRGVIWYQGESNGAGAYVYRTLFPALIKNWRDDWKQGDFPFLYVQLAPYDPGAPAGGPKGISFAEIRDSQFYVNSKKIPKVAMAVITDTVPTSLATDIHPTNKEPVGQRLALAARALAYGEKIVYSGPIYESMKVEGGKIRLTFNSIGAGLVADGGGLMGFTIAGADRQFVAAKAEIQDKCVIVSAAGVAAPVAVRYGWANCPEGNLCNAEKLPASPFRTDDFQLTTQPAK